MENEYNIKVKKKFIDACFNSDGLSTIINILETFPEFDPNCMYEEYAYDKFPEPIENICCKGSNINIIKTLLADGRFNINHSNYPLLEVACRLNNTELILLLFDDLRLDYTKTQAISATCCENNNDILKLLLSKKSPEIPINYCDYYEHPIAYSIVRKNINVFTTLLEDHRLIDFDPTINLDETKNSSALHQVCKYGTLEMLKILWSYPQVQLKISFLDYYGSLIGIVDGSECEVNEKLDFLLENIHQGLSSCIQRVFNSMLTYSYRCKYISKYAYDRYYDQIHPSCIEEYENKKNY